MAEPCPDDLCLYILRVQPVSTLPHSVIPGLANWASLVGLGVSILGFALTLWQLKRTRGAAAAAKTAAEDARKTIEQYDAAVDLAAAVTSLDDVKRLYRFDAIEVLPDRYSIVRQRIVTVRERAQNLTLEHRNSLQTVVQQIAQLGREVEVALAGSRTSLDRVKHSDVVGRLIDRLAVVAAALRR